MPHQIIEYSANLDTRLDIARLVEAMHETAAGIDALPTAGLRTRAARRDLYRIADGHPDNAFINVTLRIAVGRTLAQKQAAGEALFETLCDFVAPVMATTPLALSCEIQEIEADTRWKHGNIRHYMTQRVK